MSVHSTVTKPYTIYGKHVSTCTRTVAVALQELNVPYNIVDVNFETGEHKSPDYLATKQPFGQIPVLVEDDGFKLFESRAIARYLIAKHDVEHKLIPFSSAVNARELALFERAMSIEKNNWHPCASGLAAEKIIKPMTGRQGSDEKAAEHIKTLDSVLDVYEKLLSNSKYLAGDDVTFADLAHLSYATLLTDMAGYKGLTDGSRPNVSRWYVDLIARPSWQKVQQAMFEWQKKQQQ